MPIAADALTSPVDPASAVVIPPGSDWRITLGYAAILDDEAYPAFHEKHHSGIDIARYGCFQAPVYAMRPGLVIDSVYLPKGFGNTVTVEHDDGTCLRYTHLDKKLVKKGERVGRGQQIGTVGKGAKKVYPAHLHLDMPRSRACARARTYYDRPAEVAERFIDPVKPDSRQCLRALSGRQGETVRSIRAALAGVEKRRLSVDLIDERGCVACWLDKIGQLCTVSVGEISHGHRR